MMTWRVFLSRLPISSQPSSGHNTLMRILGIDPGTTRVGYGIISASGSKLVHEQSGLLSVARSLAGGERLLAIAAAVDDIIRSKRPDRVGIERLFLTKNHKTAMGVAEARGAILAAVASRRIPVIELTPSAVKLAVAGDGRASKASVAHMVCLLLKIRMQVVDDVTDALAVAIAVSNGALAERPGTIGVDPVRDSRAR